MTDRARLLRALLRQDLSCFVEKAFRALEPGVAYEHNWHIDHICWQLSRVASGELRRLIINVPPRSMKSITASIAFPAWLMGHNPAMRVICVSYAEELARKLSIDARRLMTSDWYQELFPALTLASPRPRTMELVTSRQGYRFAAGMNGAILGRGADLILIDDPIKATDALSRAERRRVSEAFDNTISTRLNDKRTGAIVLIMQRLHQDDLAGHVLAHGEWEVASIPAIATHNRSYRVGAGPGGIYRRRTGEVLHAREPREVLEEIRRAQGSMTFSAQYQQEPVPAEGNVIRREWLRTYAHAPESFDFVLASWDTASTLSETADYSVGTIWGSKGLDFYLLDVVRGRFETPKLRKRIVALSRAWQADQTVIEDAGIGRAVVQDLRHSGEHRAILYRPRFDKEARFLAQSARFEAGQVHVPEDAPWLADWLQELLAFPHGRHDDQVDSTSQALHYLSARTRTLHPPQPQERRYAIRRDIARRPGFA